MQTKPPVDPIPQYVFDDVPHDLIPPLPEETQSTPNTTSAEVKETGTEKLSQPPLAKT